MITAIPMVVKNDAKSVRNTPLLNIEYLFSLIVFHNSLNRFLKYSARPYNLTSFAVFDDVSNER